MIATRRLAAILAADVVGYSRLMGAGEEGTLKRLKALRHEFLDPKIAERRGRLVKTAGDGLLVEFGSVVDVLRCAVEVQREMIERDAGVSSDNRIEFRIGINVVGPPVIRLGVRRVPPGGLQCSARSADRPRDDRYDEADSSEPEQVA